MNSVQMWKIKLIWNGNKKIFKYNLGVLNTISTYLNTILTFLDFGCVCCLVLKHVPKTIEQKPNGSAHLCSACYTNFGFECNKIYDAV